MAATLTVPTIFTAIDRFSLPVGRMSAKLTSFATQSQRHFARLGDSAKKVADGAKRVAINTGIGALAIATPLYFATQQAVEFQKGMSNVSTLVDTNKESMTAMGAEVLKVFRKVPVPLEDLTHGLYMIRSDAIPAAKAIDVLKTSALLGVTGLSTTAQAANVLTSAVNVFKDEGLSATQIAGSFFETVKSGKTTMSFIEEAFGATAPIIHSAGVKLTDFLSATAALTNSGMPAAQAMNELRAAVTSLEKPSKVMTGIFHGLGIKGKGADGVRQLIAKFGNLGNAIQGIENKGNKMGSNMAKAWRNVMAFGAVTLLTGMTKQNYLNNLEAMKNGVADFAAAQKKQLSTAASQMQLLKNNAKAFAITVGTKLLPVLIKIVEKISPVLDRMITWIEKNPELTKTILKLTLGLSALLLVTSAISGVVSVVATGVKLYAAANLWLTTTSLGAAIAMKSESVAMGLMRGELALTLTKFQTLSLALIGIAGLVYEVDKHWKSWGDSISAMLGPLGQVANMLETIKNKNQTKKDMQGGLLSGEGKVGARVINGYAKSIQSFYSKPFEAILNAVGLTGVTKKIQQLNGENSEAQKPPLPSPQTKAQILNMNNNTNNTLGININDPNGWIKSTQQSGPVMIPVKVSSTQGQR